MKTLWLLSFKSIRSRQSAFSLSIISIAISIILLLGINQLQKDTKTHFLNTISQTQLIAAAPNGAINILLTTIFHIGESRDRIKYESFKKIKKIKEVAWAIPIALGDSHKGFSVIGSDNSYFKHYQYQNKKYLTLKKGSFFKNFYDVVIGANIAKQLHYKIGDTIHLEHAHKHLHANRDFKIVGILSPSITPNDNTLFVQLKVLEAIHIEWQSGHFVDMHLSSESLTHMKIVPKHLSGVLIGLKDKSTLLHVKDTIMHFKDDNIQAIIPAKALASLFKLLKNMQSVLSLISSAVFIAAIFGMLSIMFSTLNERRREISIFRALGAPAKTIFLLFGIEAFLSVLGGIVLGIIILKILLFTASILYAVPLYYHFNINDTLLLLAMLFIGVMSSFLPALQSYKHSLQDGLMVKN